MYARRHDYAAARDILVANRGALTRLGIPIPELLEKRLRAFEPLAKFSHARTAEERFALGLAEAAAARTEKELAIAFREAAVETFASVETLAPQSELAAKSDYLRAAALRRLQNHAASFAVIEHFLKAHPASPLYDDMLAEKGLHLRRVRDDDAAAAAVFVSVSRQFPKANAADNALTFLAEIHERQGRFYEAFRIYSHVGIAYAQNRLGKLAAANARSLVPIVRSRRMSLGFGGLSVARDVDVLTVRVVPGSDADRAGIDSGDELQAVGDTWVRKPAAFGSVMKAHSLGERVALRFRTLRGVRIVSLPVRWTETYTFDESSEACPY